MKELLVSVEANASEEDRVTVQTHLAKFVIEKAGKSDFIPLNVFLRDPTGGIHGGLLGWTVWSWLHIDTLWVSEEFRLLGYGRRILKAAERAARLRGCKLVDVDTFDFQARGFYEKAGYEVFGKLENINGAFTRFYMSKKI